MPPIPSQKGGPGTGDPNRVILRWYPMRDLLKLAYGVEAYQIVGPNWLFNTDLPPKDVFDVDAVLPVGTSKEQYVLMLQNMLVERFHLGFHFEKKTMSGYTLVVEKRNLNLQESPKFGGTVEEKPPIGPVGKDGFPLMPAGYTGMFSKVESNRVKSKFMAYPMDGFARYLQVQLETPVVDRTNLPGKYDFMLEYFIPTPGVPGNGTDTPPENTRADMISALRSDLGLKLIRENVPVENLVVDRIDKSPTAN
jgi:uncharacterized protein (TIGR03435 family)